MNRWRRLLAAVCLLGSVPLAVCGVRSLELRLTMQPAHSYKSAAADSLKHRSRPQLPLRRPPRPRQHHRLLGSRPPLDGPLRVQPPDCLPAEVS
jgi:hypothetical protein